MRVCVEVMEVVKGHQASFPLLPKEGLLCDRVIVSRFPVGLMRTHNCIMVWVFLVTKTLRLLSQLVNAPIHTDTRRNLKQLKLL